MPKSNFQRLTTITVVCVGLLVFSLSMVAFNTLDVSSLRSTLSLARTEKNFNYLRSDSVDKKDDVPDNSTSFKTLHMKKDNIPSNIETTSNLVNIQESSLAILKNSRVYFLFAKPPPSVKLTNQFVLLLHGHVFSSKTWKEIGTIQLLAALGYYVVALDLPAHGKTTGPTFDPKFLSSFLGKLQSHSFLKGITLPPPVIVTPSFSGKYAMPLIREQIGVSPEKATLSGIVTVTPVDTDTITKEEYSKILIPTLILRGSEDIKGAAVANNLKEIECSEEVVIAKASHPAYMDQPEIFHTLLYNFLKYISKE